VLEVRNVVWCTGFRPDFSWIRIPVEFGDDGYPVQYRGAAASSPGLYFAGLPFLHSFASMLIAGSARDSGDVARQILERGTPMPDGRTAERAVPAPT
jgi:putative flavoprotein involved in K+ transport